MIGLALAPKPYKQPKKNVSMLNLQDILLTQVELISILWFKFQNQYYQEKKHVALLHLVDFIRRNQLRCSGMIFEISKQTHKVHKIKSTNLPLFGF